MFRIILRNNTELNIGLYNDKILQSFEKCVIKIQRTQDTYKFWKEVNEIISSINSQVRSWKINHLGPRCSFYEFYEWYIFQKYK